MLVLFSLLWTELKAIDKDRTANEVAQAGALLEQRTNFKAVLEQDKDQFLATIKSMSEAQDAERTQFRKVLEKEQQLFDHEERLAESTSGVLIPALYPPLKIGVLKNTRTALQFSTGTVPRS